jgi:magnesium-transporting ATPase (P-type)
MVTGDARETAESIAHELGFFDRGVDEALSGTPHGHPPTRQGLEKLSAGAGRQN